MFRNLNKNKAFSIIELLTVMVVLSIIMGAVIGIFVSAVRIQRYTLSFQQLLDQVSYTMEYMGRAIRMAQKDDGTCGFSGQNYQVSDANRKIEFQTYQGDCQEFFLDTATNQLNVDRTGYTLPLSLTSDKFEITSLIFNISGASLQPKITVSMKIEGKNITPAPKINIQTTISQRNLNI